MTTRWCIAACVLLAMFASSANANLFDDVADFVKDSQAMEAFKEKLFDEDYAEATDAMKEANLDAYSAADAAGTQLPAFPQLFEGTEEEPEEEPLEAQEAQPVEPCDTPEEEAMTTEKPEQYIVEEEQPADQELEVEKLPLEMVQMLQAVLSADARTAAEQFEEEFAAEEAIPLNPLAEEEEAPRDPREIFAEVEEYCSKYLRECEMQTCAGQEISENSCEKGESGYQTSCSCGGTSSSSFSGAGFSGFSSSRVSTSFANPGDGFVRNMFSRRFGPPDFSVEGPRSAPRALPPLLSMLSALANRNSVSMAAPFEEEEEEARPTIVDVTDLLRGPDGFSNNAISMPLLRPMSIVRAVPMRLSVFRGANDEEPQQFNAEPLQTVEDTLPKPVAPAEPVVEPVFQAAEKKAFDPFEWQRSESEWKVTKEKEEDGERRHKDHDRDSWREEKGEGKYAYDWRRGDYGEGRYHLVNGEWRHNHERIDGPHRGKCMLVMGFVALLLASTIFCCCARRPSAEEEEVVVDVVGVDAYTPLMDTYVETECAEAEKPLMPLDFEEPIKNPLKA